MFFAICSKARNTGTLVQSFAGFLNGKGEITFRWKTKLKILTMVLLVFAVSALRLHDQCAVVTGKKEI
jgi:hypothetical protein